MLVTLHIGRRTTIGAGILLDVAVWGGLGGILGAKLLMIALNAPRFIDAPGRLFTVASLRAGGVFYGGLIAGLSLAFVYMRRRGLPAMAVADVFAPGIALGLAIGRVGCLSAGCCWGIECRRSWGVTFTDPAAHRLTGVPLGVSLHPTQVYEGLADFAVFIVLWRTASVSRRPGSQIALYLLMYSGVRFLVEFARAHGQSNPLIAGLVLEQWIAVGLAGVGGWFLTCGIREPSKT